MINYLLHPINSFYEEITQLQGKALFLDTFVKNYEEQLLKENRPYKEILSSGSFYRNLTKLGKGNNLYPTGYIYKLDVDDLKIEAENIRSRELCLNLSQAYEIFESYLSEIFTEFLYRNQAHLKSTKILDSMLWQTKATVREKVKELSKKEKNNRKYFNVIRKISPFYKHHEIVNIWDLEISVWFDLLSDIRHLIIHNRQVVTNKFLDSLRIDKRRKKVFDRYFENRVVGGKLSVYFNHSKFLQSVDLLGQLADLIFRALSTEAGIDPVYRKI